MHADSKLMSGRIAWPRVDHLAGVFTMLSDPTRINVVLALRDFGELSVNHLADIVEKSPASVSQHLAKMRLARMVAARQDGQRVFYRLADEHAAQLVTVAMLHIEHAVDGVPRHHRRTEDEESRS